MKILDDTMDRLKATMDKSNQPIYSNILIKATMDDDIRVAKGRLERLGQALDFVAPTEKGTHVVNKFGRIVTNNDILINIEKFKFDLENL